MKFRYILLFVLVGLVFVSCVKLDEGPNYSLFTKNQRLAREWVVDSMVNPVTGDVFSNQDMNDLRLIFEKKDNVTFFEKDTSGILIENPTIWTWFQPGYMIQLDLSNSPNVHISGEMKKYIVKRLTRNELILEDNSKGFRLYFHAF